MVFEKGDKRHGTMDARYNPAQFVAEPSDPTAGMTILINFRKIT
jgi:hypothetical protein